MRELKVKVGGETSGFELAMARVRGQAAALGRSITSDITGRIAGLFALGAIEQAIHKTAQYAGQLTDISARTGASVESLQRLDRAARENGTSLEALVNLWERVGAAREDALRNPGKGAAKAFGALGIDSGMLKSASPDEIVRKIAESFQNSANVDQLIAPLREIGGRGAGQMIALFRAGLDQQYQDIQVITEAEADLLDALDDKWSTLTQKISVGLAPALVWLIEKFQAFINKIKEISAFIGGFIGGASSGIKPGGKQDFFKDVANAIDEGMTAGGQAALDEVARQNAEAAKEKADREQRIKQRLQFGKFDYNYIEPEAQKRKDAKVGELKLDDLSRAGLFAGGATLGTVNNIPERQLEAMEKIVEATTQTNQILEESL